MAAPQGNLPYAYSSHYAQAYYMQAAAAASPSPVANNELNASSSTYHISPPTSTTSVPSGSWYQPGNSRCTHKGCSFTGSARSIETHMMDRHLVYPPGWDNRPKRPEWDADPSLKGKRIPIQGASVNLDDPEVLAAWIAERKKRWPTQSRVTEKKRKLDEAIERGQLPFGPSKRIRTNEGNSRRQDTRHSTGKERTRGAAAQARNSAGPRAVPADATSHPKRAFTNTVEVQRIPSSRDPDSDDGPPEAQSSKDVPQPPQTERVLAVKKASHETATQTKHSQDTLQKRGPSGPKAPRHNPFAARPALLRNLLLPEIRVTVSNLSQAIRFLVDNDFLENVELRPGQAEERKIQVLDSPE